MKWSEETHGSVCIIDSKPRKILRSLWASYFCFVLFFLYSEGVKLVQKWKREYMQSLSAVHWVRAKVRWKHESVFQGQLFVPK